MKPRGFLFWSFTVCILFCADMARATVSFWDPEGFRGNYNVYAGAIPLGGNLDTNGWARNTNGAASGFSSIGFPADQGVTVGALQAFTEGDAMVFCVGAGATNSGNAATTTTFTNFMNNNHTIAGIFDGSLNNKACKVTINGTGVLTLASGIDAFNITTASDSSQGVVTLNVPLAGSGVLTAENSGGQIFLNASNTWTGGTQLGISNATAFTGTINFNNNSSFGSGPIVIVSGNSGGSPTLQCTNVGVTITNPVDFSQALSAAPFLNLAAGTNSPTFSGPWTFNTNAVNLGVSANTVTISGPVTGTAGITKFNGGTLVLSGNNSLSGGTTISAGTLQVGLGGTSGNLGSGSITDNGALVYNRSDTVAVTDAISGTGSLTQSGTGTLVLSNANSYAGQTTVSAGTLRQGVAGAIPSGTIVKIGSSSATLDLSGLAATLTSLFGPGNVINSAGTFIINGNSTTAGVNNTYSCLSGAIMGSCSLDKQGTHAMALRGANTFSGGIVSVDAGTLSIGAAANRLPTAATLLLQGGTFQLDANNQTIGLLTGSGGVNLGGGVLTVNQSSGSTFAGVIRESDLGATSTASGNGLRGYYYDNEDFTSLKAVRDDTNGVNFASLTVTNAVTGLPPAFGTATNQVSVRWLGQVLTPNTNGTYTFTTTTDDGARLWVNGALVVDSWVDQGSTARSGTINLTGNTRYDIVMEYYNNAGGANAVLSWTPPGGTSAVIPSSNLFLPGAGAFVKLGGGALTLSGVNTYTGTTVVGGGTLEISSTNGLASATVLVTNSATLKLDATNALSAQTSLILNTNGGATPTVNLAFTGTLQLGQLSLDGGTTFLSGTWGGTGSGAQHINSHLIGSGVLNPQIQTVCAATNRILSITNSAFRTVTLTLKGTPGAQYYIITHTNVLQPVTAWTPVPGSTNTAPAGNGIWSLSISNPAPTAAYRMEAISACP